MPTPSTPRGGFWEEPFLDPALSDILSLLSGIGVVLTFVGVILTWRQIKKTSDAANAAKSAALETLEASKRDYNRYVRAQISRLLSECNLHANHSEWLFAAIRLDDIQQLLLQVTRENKKWSDIASRTRGISESFERLGNKELKSFASFRKKWHDLKRDLRDELAAEDGPFVSASTGGKK